MLLEGMSNIKQRLIISSFCIAIVIFSLIFSTHPIFRPIYALIVAAVISLALWEYYHIAHGRGLAPLSKGGIIASIAYVYASFLSLHHPCCTVVPFVFLWLALIGTFLSYMRQGKDPFNNIAITLFGLAYITLPLTLVIDITYWFPESSLQDGRWWLFYLIFITKITDTGAFFVGKKWGKHKLVPVISPNKTWEGALGGLCTAIIASLLFNYLITIYYSSAPFQMTTFQSVWIAASISILAQIGDLAESLLKRDAGVKDSSQLPGLGGMLDVVDSLIFTCPFLYFLLTWTLVQQ